MPTVFATLLVRQIIDPALELEVGPKPTMATKFPADLANVLPIIIGKSTAGSELDPRFGADFAVLQFDVYAADETEAQKWCAWCRDQVFSAYTKQTEYEEGHLTSFTTDQVPSRFPDNTLPADIERYMTQLRVGVKPPPP